MYNNYMGKKTTDEIILEMYAMMQTMATKDDLEMSIGRVERRLEGIENLLDTHTELLDKDELERLALSAQVSRHDDWIVRAADKTGIRYAS